MAKQISQFTAREAPLVSDVLLVEPANGSGTFKMTIEALLALYDAGDNAFVTEDALAAWVGSENIATVGTITTGTWQGGIIDAEFLDLSGGAAPLLGVVSVSSNNTALANDVHNKTVLINNGGSAWNFTLPANAPLGTKFRVNRGGTGAVTALLPASTTLNTVSGYTKIGPQHGVVTFILVAKTSINAWIAYGDLVA